MATQIWIDNLLLKKFYPPFALTRFTWDERVCDDDERADEDQALTFPLLSLLFLLQAEARLKNEKIIALPGETFR